MVKTLLPHNASTFERNLEQATGPELLRPAPLREIWSPESCPSELLPWLAHAFSVDAWDPEWPVAVKREVIRQSVAVHRVKGTRGALLKALEAAGFRIDLIEGWEEGGAAHTFRLDAFGADVFAAGLAIDAKLRDRLDRLVEAVKPVRSHYSMRIGQSVKTPLFARAGTSASQIVKDKIDAAAPSRVSLSSAIIRSITRARLSVSNEIRPHSAPLKVTEALSARAGSRARQSMRVDVKITLQEVSNDVA